MSEPRTLFERIIAREIPAEILYEDEQCLAFRDVSPKAPTHVLVIPKRPIPSLADVQAADAGLLGHLLVTVHNLAIDLNLENGYRVVINCGADGGQSVPHLHLHLLGGRGLGWPPG